MFEIKWEDKWEETLVCNDEGIKNALSTALETAVLQNGCTKCHGKNLTVYVNSIEQNSIDGYFYCHDCNSKGNVRVAHEIYNGMDEAENQLKELLGGLQ